MPADCRPELARHPVQKAQRGLREPVQRQSRHQRGEGERGNVLSCMRNALSNGSSQTQAQKRGRARPHNDELPG